MQVDVVVLGAAGFGGGELLRLLCRHPAVSSILPVSRSAAGHPIDKVHPHLHSLHELRFQGELDIQQLESEKPLAVFSAMQHGDLAREYAELNRRLENLAARRPVVLLDLSGDFRLTDAAKFEAAYGEPHPCPEQLGNFTYGLPEQNREVLRSATRIACPGCFATAMSLALLPLAAQPLGFIALSGVTGSSGSGARPSETTHHPARANDFRSYSPLRHRHLAEVEQVLEAGGSRSVMLSFVPHSAPLVRGIHVTAQCVFQHAAAADGAGHAIENFYRDEPFVRVVPRAPRIATVAGSNYAELAWFAEGERLAVMCTLDNLGKGMAGQAVQNMNLALGFEETLGLLYPAVYP